MSHTLLSPALPSARLCAAARSVRPRILPSTSTHVREPGGSAHNAPTVRVRPPAPRAHGCHLVGTRRPLPAGLLHGVSRRSTQSIRHAALSPAHRAISPSDRHLCGAGRAGFNLASVCRGQSRRCWAADGVILRCRWPRLRSGALAGAAGSASARVAADVRCSRPLLGGGWLARPRWAEAAERPTQVAWAEPVAGTAGTEGGTASD